MRVNVCVCVSYWALLLQPASQAFTAARRTGVPHALLFCNPSYCVAIRRSVFQPVPLRAWRRSGLAGARIVAPRPNANPSLCVAACASSCCAAFGFLWQLILHKSEEQMRQDFRIEKRIKLDGSIDR